MNIIDTVRSSFNFQVQALRLSGPDNMRTNHFGLFRSDSSECVGAAVSGASVPHTTENVIAGVEAASRVFPSDEVECQTHFDAGHHVQILPGRENRRTVYDDAAADVSADNGVIMSDAIFPRLTIDASYDYRGFRVHLGMYRDCCDNLQMLRSVKSATTVVRHNASLSDGIEDIVEALSTLTSAWDSVVDACHAMDSKKVVVSAFLRKVYGDLPEGATERMRKSHEKRTEKILGRLVRETIQTGRDVREVEAGKCSAWMAYQAVQGYAQHDTSRRGSPSAIVRAMRSDQSKAVRLAESLALGV